MKLQLKSTRARALKLALVAIVLTVAATAVAFSLNPPEWFGAAGQKPGAGAPAVAPIPARP